MKKKSQKLPSHSKVLLYILLGGLLSGWAVFGSFFPQVSLYSILLVDSGIFLYCVTAGQFLALFILSCFQFMALYNSSFVD